MRKNYYIGGFTMEIIQNPMRISDEAAKGILSGELVRHGGVVYHKGGGVFEHLKDVKISDQTEEAVSEVAQKASFNVKDLVGKTSTYVSKNKGKVSLIIGGTMFIGASVIYGINKLTKKKEEDAKIEVITDTEFNESLTNYITAAREGKLSLPLIIDFKEQLNKISEIEDSVVYSIDVHQLIKLIGYIEKYTEDLAADNNYQIADEQKGSVAEDHITNLTKYLVIQEDIFSKAS